METSLQAAIEAARRRLGLSQVEYAARVGLTAQALAKIARTNGVSGKTLARLQEHGGVRITKKLIASLRVNETKAV